MLVGDNTPRSLAGSSRYCTETFVYPSPISDPAGFIRVIKQVVKGRGIQIVLPMTDLSAHLILKHRSELPPARLPFPSLDCFEAVTDKWRLHGLARQLGIPTPDTHCIRNREELQALMPYLPFPIVLKPCHAMATSNGRRETAAVRYASCAGDLEMILSSDSSLPKYPVLIQERIPGQAFGIFTLYERGRPLTFFAHKRLREKPPSGGVSVVSETVSVDPHMRLLTQGLLDSLAWHGVAMAEFKVTPEGTPYLLEVNARFWGSLQLAVDAGVDFPWLLYQLARGGPIDSVAGYQVGIRNRWLLGDLDSLYIGLKGGEALRQKLRRVFAFLNSGHARTRYEVNRWEDMAPFYLELRQYFSALRK